MKTSSKFLLPLLFAGAVSACSDEGPVGPVDGGNEEIVVPQAYTFESRFEEGVSSVAYPGQTVRNLLVQDLAILIKGLGKEGAGSITEQDLLNLYAYDDALDLTTLTSVDPAALESRYSAIATNKNLTGKISDAVVIGYDKTADELLRGWFKIIAQNSQDPNKLGTPAVFTTAEGVDLSQMVEKLLHGAVAYSQGTNKYLLDKNLFVDNEAPSGDNPFTAMEHHWDEAFGYFGAARDYFGFTDAELKSGFYADANGDQKIDFTSEYNFAFAKGAGKRDAGVDGRTDFTSEIFDAFLTGRALISGGASAADIAVQRDLVVQGWEKVTAATVVHYINETLADMANIGTAEEDRTGLNKHWAEMRAYAIALQYNEEFGLIDEPELLQLAALLGTAPVYATPAATDYDEALLEARDLLQSVYGFSDVNVQAW